MEPCYNEVPWYQNNLLLVTRCIVGTSLQRSIAGQGVIWGGERVEPGEMRWCRQSTLVHLLKSFLEWYERDIERARYCPQDRESVQHEDIWHQNGITEWQHQRHVSRLCYIPPPPTPPSRPPLFPFGPCFLPFSPTAELVPDYPNLVNQKQRKYFEWKIMYCIVAYELWIIT